MTDIRTYSTALKALRATLAAAALDATEIAVDLEKCEVTFKSTPRQLREVVQQQGVLAEVVRTLRAEGIL